jgi:hypothetical protein
VKERHVKHVKEAQRAKEGREKERGLQRRASLAMVYGSLD